MNYCVGGSNSVASGLLLLTTIVQDGFPNLCVTLRKSVQPCNVYTAYCQRMLQWRCELMNIFNPRIKRHSSRVATIFER